MLPWALNKRIRNKSKIEECKFVADLELETEALQFSKLREIEDDKILLREI